MPSRPKNKDKADPQPEKILDEEIFDMINQRRIQQGALLKIKASVAKRQWRGMSADDRENEKLKWT